MDEAKRRDVESFLVQGSWFGGLPADRLADLADLRHLEVGAKREAVTLDLSRSHLASIVGLSRPNLNTRLRRLQDEGWIALERGRIHVLDKEGLRATAVARSAPRSGQQSNGAGRATLVA